MIGSVFVYPSSVSGCLTAPPSKSYMQRAVAASLLCERTVRISNVSYCSDSMASLRVARVLGAEILAEGNTVRIRGKFKPGSVELDCGESGLCMRMFTPIAALAGERITLTASGTLKSRTMTSIEKTLKLLGADCSTTEGKAPLTVRGPLLGGRASLDSSVTSQFLTGLLMALPLAGKNSVLLAENLSSKPYINMTLDVLKQNGIEIQWDGEKQFQIPGNQKYSMEAFDVEGDWSGAAFALVAGATAGSVSVCGLNSRSLQADRSIISALREAGADIQEEGDTVTVNRSKLEAFDFDVSECPDLAPPLAVLAASCRGTSRIRGIQRLSFKESNRATALTDELGKVGVELESTGNSLFVTGKRITAGGTAWSRGDHRIAMALAVAALNSDRGISIEGADSVSKSYPGFFSDLGILGVNLDE